MTAGKEKRPPDLGARLQALRKARRLTLDRLAGASGVSKSMLSQIERGRVNPTVATLWNLTGALGVDMADLLGAPTAKGAQESRRVERLTVHATPSIASADGRCSLRILNPRAGALSFEWYEMTFEPGGELRSDPHSPGAREHLTLMEGALQVELPDSLTKLSAGETLRYSADQPHAIVNEGTKKAKALLVVEFTGEL